MRADPVRVARVGRARVPVIGTGPAVVDRLRAPGGPVTRARDARDRGARDACAAADARAARVAMGAEITVVTGRGVRGVDAASTRAEVVGARVCVVAVFVHRAPGAAPCLAHPARAAHEEARDPVHHVLSHAADRGITQLRRAGVAVVAAHRLTRATRTAAARVTHGARAPIGAGLVVLGVPAAHHRITEVVGAVVLVVARGDGSARTVARAAAIADRALVSVFALGAVGPRRIGTTAVDRIALAERRAAHARRRVADDGVRSQASSARAGIHPRARVSVVADAADRRMRAAAARRLTGVASARVAVVAVAAITASCLAFAVFLAKMPLRTGLVRATRPSREGGGVEARPKEQRQDCEDDDPCEDQATDRRVSALGGQRATTIGPSSRSGTSPSGSRTFRNSIR
jgi:hypothetical protein